MPAFVLADGQVWLGADNITSLVEGIGDTNGTTNMVEYFRLDSGGFRHFLPGVNTFTTMVVGNVGYATGEIGQVVTPAQRGQQYALSIMPQNGAALAAGDPAILTRGLLREFKITGKTGEVQKYALGMTSDLIQVEGAVAAPLASRTTAGYTGPAVAMTGPAAGQRLYAALHVNAAAGTNLAVRIQSDNASGFPSPTDRITFSTVSATGWQFLSVDGSLVSETHWRAIATIASGTFTFGVTFGVA